MEKFRTDGPAFCKIIMGDFVQELRIPPAFVEKYGAFFSQKVTLETDSGSSWDVRIEKMDGHYWFTNGWQKFVKENSLNFPDFVTFLFVKNSKILVTIFDKNACRRDAPMQTPRPKNPSTRIIQHDASESTKFTFKWRKCMRNCLPIKGSVCKKLRLAREKTAMMMNLEGRIYEVKLFGTADGRAGMGEGWADFVDASNFVVDKTYQFSFFRRCNGGFLLQLSLIDK